jgi:hypothetical protein
MIKIMGALFITAGSAGAISCWLEAEKKRQSLIEEWIKLFVRWEYALKCRKRVYDFFESYDTDFIRIKAFLIEVCRRLRSNTYPSGKAAWNQLLNENRSELIPNSECYEIIAQSAEAFFGGSSEECLNNIRVCRERMEQCLKEMREKLAGKKRIYIPAGMLGGAVLIILLI